MMLKSFAGAHRAVRACSRRSTLLTAGGAVLAAAATRTAPDAAGKSGSRARQRCRRQREQCRAYVTAICEKQTDAQACQARFLPCCDHFAQCDAGPAVACLLTLD